MVVQPDQSTFRSYLLFFGGQMVSLLGSSIAQFVVILWVTVTTGSAFLTSMAAFAGLVPMVLLMPVAGVLVDRAERRRFIAIVDFIQALTTVMLILAFWTSLVSIWVVLALVGLRGVCQAFHLPAVSSIVPAMVPKDKLSRMNGLNFVLFGAVQLVAPAMAAVLLLFASIDQILWLDPITFLVALVALLTIRIPRVNADKPKGSFRKDFAEGLSFMIHKEGLLPLSMLATALNFLLSPLSALMSYFVIYDHLGDASVLALVLISLQGGLLVGGLMMSVLKDIKRKVTMSLVFVFAVFMGYVVVALTPVGSYWLLAAAVAAMGFAVAPANVLINTVIQTIVPLNMMGRVDSVSSSISSAASPIGFLLSGAIVGFIGTGNLFLACAIAGMVTVVVSLLFTNVASLDQPPQQTEAKGA